MREHTVAASPPCGATELDWGIETKPALAVLVLAGGRGARIGGGKPERTLAGYRLIDHALHFARRSSGLVALGLHAPDQVDARADMHVVLDRSGIEGPLASLAAGLTWAKRSAADYLLTLPCDAPFLPHDLAARLKTRLVRGQFELCGGGLLPPPLEGEGAGGWGEVVPKDEGWSAQPPAAHAPVEAPRSGPTTAIARSAPPTLSPPPLPLPPLEGGELICSGGTSRSFGVALPESHGRVHPSCAMWRTSVIAQMPTYLSSGRRSLTGFAEHVGYTVEDWGSPARDPFFNINTADDLAHAEAWLAQPHFE